MNVLPIIFLFCSGSVTPSSLERNISCAFTKLTERPIFSFRPVTTFCASSFLSKPWSTMTHVSLLPKVLCKTAASTVESTPPLKANNTSSSLTSVATTASICCRISSELQFCSIPHISRKFFMIAVPFSVWVTSG